MIEEHKVVWMGWAKSVVTYNNVMGGDAGVVEKSTGNWRNGAK